MQELTVVDSEPESQPTAHIVHVLLQFALAVRHRRNVVVAAMLVSGLLGGLYYATATRYYSAKASLLVLQPGSEMSDGSTVPAATSRQGLMPTYENMIASPKVLEGALPDIPPEDCVDFAQAPRERWPEILKKNLSAQTIRFTNIIEVEYRSKDPKAAVSVVKAVVDSYLDFMDRTHKGTAREIIEVLTREQVQRADELRVKEAELQQARQQAGELGSGEDDKLMHPLTQRVVSFNDALLETQKQRVTMEATLAAIESSIRNGEGLQQYVMTVADMVGREILLESLGINDQDAATQASLERDLLTDGSRLQAMEEHLGPRHPDVVGMKERMRQTQQYLAAYPDRMRQRLAEIQEARLGPMLREMIQQKLNETCQRELALKVEYDKAQAEAAKLVDQLAQIDTLEHEVARLRGLHDLLLDRIANFDIKHEGPDILVAPLADPTEATAPSSPDAARVLFVVIVGGIAAGLLAVYVLDVLDDRFRSLEEMQRQLGAPVLSIVRRLHSQEGAGMETLQVYSQPDAAESEAFRTLRTALSLTAEESSRIVISSAEPGDGKTTILANLAVAYAQSGGRTLIIDADLRRPGLTNMLGLRSFEGLSSVIRGRDDVAAMMGSYARASGVSGLDVLPSGPRPTNPAELLASARFAELLAWAETVYDHILIDSPPALATSDAAVIGRLVDGAMLVVQPGKNRRRSVLRATESFVTLKIKLLGVVINRVANERDGGYYGYGYGDGYDYHYSYGEDYDQDAEHPQGEPDPVEASSPRRPDEVATASAGIVPRRAA